MESGNLPGNCAVNVVLNTSVIFLNVFLVTFCAKLTDCMSICRFTVLMSPLKVISAKVAPLSMVTVCRDLFDSSSSLHSKVDDRTDTASYAHHE